MQTVARTSFTTVTTEGAILPADLLQRIVDGRDLEGLRPEDYHLAPNERLNEAISRSWNRLLGVWEGFDEQRQTLPESDRGTTLTRERWLLILLQELGYGRLPFQGSLPIDPDHPESTRYPISHEYDRVPIHLVSFRQPLDRADADRAERFHRSPHSLVQEFLNRSDDHLWGFVANGLRLRILRDNVSFTRTAFLEFDLEAMMEGEIYADFILLWLTAHQSRVEGAPETCWLEKWSQEAAAQGTRALETLRDGVEEAIEHLGQGFLAHPANGELRRRLQSGDLTTSDYYRQLLRLVYRLIFLFVAEDRDLLLRRDAAAETRDRYMQFYSVTRLRELAARRRSGPHPDQYRALRLVLELLREGYPELGLPGLGGFLFSARSTPDLDAAEIANETLLDAVRALAFTIEGRVLRPVDYKNLGAEELGSVYESLLELHPELSVAAATFALKTAAGSERKTTGSYYTPTSLINSLLDSALEPVVAERLRAARERMRQGSGEKGLGNRGREDERTDSDVSGSDRVAGGHGSGHGSLPADEGISPRGAVRHDLPDSPSGRLDPGQHSRGLRPGEPERLHSLPQDSPGLAQGAGDSPATGGARGSDDSGGDRAATATDRGGRQDALGAHPRAGAENDLTPHSPLPTPYSPLEEALLSIKVVDPAAGSGHFLIAAANRLATHLARIRTGDEEPSPADRRDALRDVVGRCIYGVDINEMAVELCKVGLWLETLDPGRPLSFLDHHIQCGNSLIGATPALLEQGIPDDAFTAITGDDGKYVSEWKKRNKQEREGQETLRFDAPWDRLGDLAAAVAALEATDDETLAGVQAREAAYAELVRSSAYEYTHLLADAWCAAFVFPKHPGIDYPVTEDDFRDIEHNPHSVARWMREEIARLRDEYQFFHWHLAFPEVFGMGSRGIGSGGIGNREMGAGNEGVGSRGVGDGPTHSPTGWSGGFDVVLGNPPWERIKLQEKEWFAPRDEAIATARNAAARRRLIARLETENPALFQEFQAAKRQAEGESHLIRNSERFPLCGRGDVNTYPIFSELARHIISNVGRAGIIVQSDIAISDTNKFFFQDLIGQQSLVSFFDFVNTEGIFPAVHRTHPHFCLLTMSGAPWSKPADFAFWNTNVAHLSDEERHFTLTAEEIALLNPNTRTCPIFRSRRDAELTKAIYRRVPVLIREGDPEVNPWGIKFSTMFHMSNDSYLFRTREQLEAEGYTLVGNVFVKKGSEGVGSGGVGSREQGIGGEGGSSPYSLLPTPHSPTRYLPLYEAKMLHHFDHRWATYENGTDTRDVTAAERDDPAFVVLPRYWVIEREVEEKLDDQGWLLAFRDITNTTNERTAIFAGIPRSAVGNNAPLLNVSQESSDWTPMLAALLSSYAFDFSARIGIGGTHMNFFIAKQLPVLPPATFHEACLWDVSASYFNWLLPRIVELAFTAYDLRPFALDCGYQGPPFHWDEERRFRLRCELDAAYFHLYGIERDDVGYIMDTFPIVRRKDEEAHGEYRTKRVILEMYDWMAERIEEGSGGIGNEGIGNREVGATPTPSLPQSPTAYSQLPTPFLSPPPAHPDAAHPWDEAYLGPELPREAWWEERGNRDWGIGNGEEGNEGIGSRGVGAAPTPSFPHSPTRSAPQAVSQPGLPVVAPPPTGPRAARLRQAMALGRKNSAAATAELVAFLADEDSNIRWLAGSSLARHEDPGAVVAHLAAFVQAAEPERVAAARKEMARVLGIIAETAEDEAVREAAAGLLREYFGD